MFPEFVIEQTNALQSWKALRCNPKIVILGDDYGVESLCKSENVIHHKTLLKNSYGTPLVADIFEQAYSYATDSDICIFVNGDIILTNSLCDGLERFVMEYPDYKNQRYMLTSIRYDWYNYCKVDFSESDWESKLLLKGQYALPTGIDLFIHRKNTIKDIPYSGIAKFSYDSWILGYAIKNFEITINTSKVIKIYHQYGQWYQGNKVCPRNTMTAEMKENSAYVNKLRKENGFTKCAITDCRYTW
jgi:hypothetical protein